MITKLGTAIGNGSLDLDFLEFQIANPIGSEGAVIRDLLRYARCGGRMLRKKPETLDR
jgi:hypothetical protein